jgi:hypothetical protein
MSEFRDWDVLRNTIPKPQKPTHIECLSCKSKFFEQVRVSKIDMAVLATIGQTVPTTMELVLLRCVKCQDLQELPINMSGSAKPLQNAYNELRETLESKPESKPEVKPVPEKS